DRRQLGGYVPEQVCMAHARRLDATGLDLDPRPPRQGAIEQGVDALMPERLAAGDHQQRRLAQRADLVERLLDRGFTPAARAPGVLGVAPVAAHVAALEPHEVR